MAKRIKHVGKSILCGAGSVINAHSKYADYVYTLGKGRSANDVLKTLTRTEHHEADRSITMMDKSSSKPKQILSEKVAAFIMTDYKLKDENESLTNVLKATLKAYIDKQPVKVLKAIILKAYSKTTRDEAILFLDPVTCLEILVVYAFDLYIKYDAKAGDKTQTGLPFQALIECLQYKLDTPLTAMNKEALWKKIIDKSSSGDINLEKEASLAECGIVCRFEWKPADDTAFAAFAI